MPRRRRGEGGERISERDLEVLEFVVWFGVVPRDALAIWARTGRPVTFARERRLREAGLIEVHPALGASAALHAVMTSCNDSLSAASPTDACSPKRVARIS